MNASSSGQGHTLKPVLSTLQLWAIAVGLVISGEYFGWSYGWASAGTLGFTVTALFIAAMYATFIFSFTELTTSIPHAGGPFAYSKRAFGPVGGYLAGAATLIEFVFAPPAIALAIGAYLNVQFPALDPKLAALGAYLVFMTLNIVGVQIAATFELCVTLLAIFELLVFMGVVAPGFSLANFTKGGWSGNSGLTRDQRFLLRDAWREFLRDHQETLAAGRRVPLTDPALAARLTGLVFQPNSPVVEIPLQDGTRWPPRP